MFSERCILTKLWESLLTMHIWKQIKVKICTNNMHDQLTFANLSSDCSRNRDLSLVGRRTQSPSYHQMELFDMLLFALAAYHIQGGRVDRMRWHILTMICLRKHLFALCVWNIFVSLEISPSGGLALWFRFLQQLARKVCSSCVWFMGMRKRLAPLLTAMATCKTPDSFTSEVPILIDIVKAYLLWFHFS